MSSAQRREQLIVVGRQLFAERGFDATSIEEIAARAKVSKPVVYEHFGGKEGLHAVVVDREVRALLERVTNALTGGHPRELLEQAALALLDYIENDTDGFRVLVRESPVMSATGNFSSVLNDVAHQVEHILGDEFKVRGFDPKLAELYSQALVGMVALTGRWWLEVRKPPQRDGRVAPRQPRVERSVQPRGEADARHVPVNSGSGSRLREPVTVRVIFLRPRRRAMERPPVIVRVSAVMQPEVVLLCLRDHRSRLSVEPGEQQH